MCVGIEPVADGFPLTVKGERPCANMGKVPIQASVVIAHGRDLRWSC